MIDWNKLTQPFAADQEKSMPQSLTVKADGSASAMALFYIDARAVAERLDEVLSPENWTFTWEPITGGGAKGTLSIRTDDNEWVSKSDVGYPNEDGDKEAYKGAVSDALKRSAVLWGVGRYLYGLGNTWNACETYTDKKTGKEKFKKWIGTPSHKSNSKPSVAPVKTTPVATTPQAALPVASKPAAAKKDDMRTALSKGVLRAQAYPIDVTKYQAPDDASDAQLRKIATDLKAELSKYEVMSEDDADWKEWMIVREKANTAGLSVPPESSFKIPMDRETVKNATKALNGALE